MKVQTIVHDNDGRAWDSIKEDASKALCRILDHMKKEDLDVATVAEEAMFLLETKNDYQSAVWLLRVCGYSVAVKMLGE